jgi:hypothetical protein
MNELKIQGIKDQMHFHDQRIGEHTKAVEGLKKELEEAQKPQFQPRVFHIRANTREELMALGAVANRPHHVAKVAMESYGRIVSLTTHDAVVHAVNKLLDPIFDAAYREAYEV